MRLLNRLVNEKFPETLKKQLTQDGEINYFNYDHFLIFGISKTGTRARMITSAIECLEYGSVDIQFPLRGSLQEQYNEWRRICITEMKWKASLVSQIALVGDSRIDILSRVYCQYLLGQEHFDIVDEEKFLNDHLFFFEEVDSSTSSSSSSNSVTRIQLTPEVISYFSLETYKKFIFLISILKLAANPGSSRRVFQNPHWKTDNSVVSRLYGNHSIGKGVASRTYDCSAVEPRSQIQTH